VGFLAPTEVFPLTFSNPTLEGLEVWMSRPSIDTIGDMMMLGNLKKNAMTQEDVMTLKRVFDAFIQCLQRWNVEAHVLDKNGVATKEVKSVPATQDGVRSLDGNFLLLIILGWVETVTGLSWSTKQIGSIPMETQQ
jgi:hypothetical protein